MAGSGAGEATPRDEIQFHRADEWTAVYLNGRLQRVGDHYLADEWLRKRAGVIEVDDDAFLRGQDQRDGVATTLAGVEAYRRQRRQVDELRRQARQLEEQARKLMEAR